MKKCKVNKLCPLNNLSRKYGSSLLSLFIRLNDNKYIYSYFSFSISTMCLIMLITSWLLKKKKILKYFRISFNLSFYISFFIFKIIILQLCDHNVSLNCNLFLIEIKQKLKRRRKQRKRKKMTSMNMKRTPQSL